MGNVRRFRDDVPQPGIDRFGDGRGSGAFVAGEISEVGLVTDRQLTANNFTEMLYTLTLVAADLADGDTLDFRVLLNGATTNVTYSVTPRITVGAHDESLRRSDGRFDLWL